jgi:trans-aconitate methyltransferase
MISQTQCEALEALHDQYAAETDLVKYAVTPHRWDRLAEQLFGHYQLDAADGKIVADVGGGFGYFANVCEQHGHITWTIDRDLPILRAAAAILQVPRAWHNIQPGGGLPGLSADIITITAVCPFQWTRHQHIELFDSLVDSLTPGGILFVGWLQQPGTLRLVSEVASHYGERCRVMTSPTGIPASITGIYK